MKLSIHVTDFNVDYQGLRNRLPSENEIITGYYSAMEFFKSEEARCNESANWYFNQARSNEVKAGEYLDQAETAHANYSHYLDLIGMTYIKKQQRLGREVKHAA